MKLLVQSPGIFLTDICNFFRKTSKIRRFVHFANIRMEKKRKIIEKIHIDSDNSMNSFEMKKDSLFYYLLEN